MTKKMEKMDERENKVQLVLCYFLDLYEKDKIEKNDEIIIDLFVRKISDALMIGLDITNRMGRVAALLEYLIMKAKPIEEQLLKFEEAYTWFRNNIDKEEK